MKRKKSEKPTHIKSVFSSEQRFPFDNYFSVKSGYSQNEDLFLKLPLISAALFKTVRLCSGFTVKTKNESTDETARKILEEHGFQSFFDGYLLELLKHGTAVTEILRDENGRARGLYRPDFSDFYLKRSEKDFSKVLICRNDFDRKPLKRQNDVFYTSILGSSKKLYGKGILEDVTFMAQVLLEIFRAAEVNFRRIGNTRFSVNYTPPSSSAFTREHAEEIAREWSEVMKSSEIKDFVAVGDVKIEPIGNGIKIPESESTVRAITEQIVSKLFVPPCLLGLSWSSTERMAALQCEVYRQELESLRGLVTPAVKKAVGAFLMDEGYFDDFEIVWRKIMLEQG